MITKDTWEKIESSFGEDIIIQGADGRKSVALVHNHSDDANNPTLIQQEAEDNADIIAAAPIRHKQLLALTKYDWEVTRISLYDEEGIEGWKWTEPDGTEHYESGDWDALPTWPDSANKSLLNKTDFKDKV